MNQVSRPMQIALVAALVFVALWFTVLRPKEVVEPPIAATPTPVATTVPRANAGGAAAQTALGKTIEGAKNAAASADADAKKTAAQTGEGDTTGTSTATTPKTSAAAPAASATTPAAGTPAAAKDDPDAITPAQAEANATIIRIQKDLKARNAVVVLVSAKGPPEDAVLRKRVAHQIDTRHGRVKTVLIDVGDVGLYDGLLSGLSIAQTPSTIVIAPNNEAKVLGGLVSVGRIDRLTSSAILYKPAA